MRNSQVQFMRLLPLIILLALTASLQAFDHHSSYKNPQDSTRNSYLLVMPDGGKAVGLVIRDYTMLPDITRTSPYQWMGLLLARGYAVLFTDTSKSNPDLFYDDEGPQMIDAFVNEVRTEFEIGDNIFIGGISASGTRALRYAQYIAEGKSRFDTELKGVFIVDSPLDIERFYLSATRNKDKFKAGMAYEASFVPNTFEEVLGGTVDEKREEYRKASVFSQFQDGYGNARHYLQTPMIFFHEPDIEWWIKERGSSYFDINSFDIAAFVNYQRINGNHDVTNIVTQGKGFDREGNHNCHSWTIVNEKLLVDWIVERTEK
jgi:hypothetical protein